MAYTKTPTQDTYDTKRFPLVGAPQQRNGTDITKDQRWLNCFPEAVEAKVSEAKKYYVKKRLGYIAQTAPGVGGARGCIYEDSTNQLYFVVGSSLYSWTGSVLTGLSASIPDSGSVGFTIHRTSSQLLVILFTRTAGYVINPVGNTLTQITDPDFPSPHVPTPVSMDGYLFVSPESSADIYNSDLDDPLSWDPSQFITAEMYSDNIVALSKNNNYVVAVGTGSIEFFYDIGNATGSPLQRNDSAVQQFGTLAPESVVQTEKELVLVGTTQTGGRTVFLIDGFKAEDIGVTAVNMSLDALSTDILNVNAYCIRTQGHKFYVMRLPDVGRTWVYDFGLKLWHEWSSTADDGVSQTTFAGKYAADNHFGYPYMLTEGTNGAVVLGQEVYQDLDRPIKAQVTTLKLDFDNMNRKDMIRLSLYGDWPLDSGGTITLEWSDDDYRTWSNPRTIALSTYLPVTRRLGKFRRRALRFTHTDATPLRLEGVELDINMGVS